MAAVKKGVGDLTFWVMFLTHPTLGSL